MSKKIKRAFLDTEDGQIHYRMGGEGEVLLLLHMNPRSSDEYRELMPILAEKYRVIAMDLMGFGDSDKPSRMYSIQDYAKTVITLFDELNIEKANLLGHHTGAFVSGEIEVSYPERVKKLILCNVAGFGECGKAEMMRRFDQGFKLKEDGSHLIERWFARKRFVDSAELNHRWVLDDLKCFNYPLYAMWAVGNYCVEAPERFKNIKCPTLIIWGLDDMKDLERLGFALVKDRLFVSESIPHGKVIEYPDGTMSMMNQKSEEIAKAVLKFLDKE